MIDLLKNYFKHRARAKAMEFGLTDDQKTAAEESRLLTAKLDFLDYCITLLGEQDKEKQELIQMFYFKRHSLRSYAMVKRIAKATANNRKAAALNDLKDLFDSRELK